MTQRAIETVTFKLAEGVSKEDFLEAVAASTAFVQARPGFVARRLSCGADGTWIEHIEWETLEAAQAAVAAIQREESVKPFLNSIEGASVTLRHSALEISVG